MNAMGSVLARMVDAGQVFAEIDGEKGMVRFLEDPERFNSAATVAMLDAQISAAAALGERAADTYAQVSSRRPALRLHYHCHTGFCTLSVCFHQHISPTMRPFACKLVSGSSKPWSSRIGYKCLMPITCAVCTPNTLIALFCGDTHACTCVPSEFGSGCARERCWCMVQVSRSTPYLSKVYLKGDPQYASFGNTGDEDDAYANAMMPPEPSLSGSVMHC